MSAIILNYEQQRIVDAAVDWYFNSKDLLFQFDGPPGSGKSVVLNAIIEALGLDLETEVMPMSYIGAAAMVMKLKGLSNAKTAHSSICNMSYTTMRDKNGKPVIDELYGTPIKVAKFRAKEKLPKEVKLIAVDEAYAMPLKMANKIMSYGIKVIACGDQNQLQSIGDKPGFLISGNIMHLTQCVRQEDRMDINYIATKASRGEEIHEGYYGNTLVIDYYDLNKKMLAWADIIICLRNETRDTINKSIRGMYGYAGTLPNYGEKLVCRKNEWGISKYNRRGIEISLVNGMIGTVCNYPDVSSYKSNLFTIDFKPDVTPDIIFRNLRVNYKYLNSESKERKLIDKDPYEPGCKFEYAYAITTHMAQGSQFHNVVYLEEKMLSPAEQARLNLVGASRADRALIYVKNVDIKGVMGRGKWNNVFS